ncbi:MAG: amidohydrolase family protein [Cyclonatronaceae bacterium]
MKIILRLCAAVLLLLLLHQYTRAQSTPAQAFTNITLHHADGTIVTSATIVWRNGTIEAAGLNVTLPFDARVRDGGDSLHVYPGFIDGYGTWGSVDTPRNQPRPERPGEPGYERAGIQPDRNTAGTFKDDLSEFTEVQKSGFTTAALGPKGFFMPGQVDIYHLRGTETPDHLMADRIAQKVQFVSSPGAYPNTLMAMMTSLRQLFHNATALYEHQNLYNDTPDRYSPAPRDAVLEALYPVMNNRIPIFFTADSREDIQRVLSLRDELGFNLVLVSGKEAYTMTEELRRNDVPVLVSIDLPEKPSHMKKKEKKNEKEDVDADPEDLDQESISDEELNFRERQKTAYQNLIGNAQQLMDAGVTTGFTSSGIKISDFSKHFQTLLENGYEETVLVRMMTLNTARILGIERNTGSIERGKLANFTVRNAPVSNKNSRVLYGISAGNFTEFSHDSRRR